MSARLPRIAVVGSINLDLVVRAERLPRPGETVSGGVFARHPGGKGANQALAAKRLGADAQLWGRVGADAFAEEALALLRADGVDLTRCSVDSQAATGVALIAVAADGENQILVAPGANALLKPDLLAPIEADALLCQLEVPPDTIKQAVSGFGGFVALNLAPARAVDAEVLQRADLIVVNEGEAAYYGPSLHALPGVISITLGKRGAALLRAGKEIAFAPAPHVHARDTTGAGDTYSAALTLALVEGRAPGAALAFACAAGALAATRDGAQPAMPTRAEVENLLSQSA